MKSKVVTTGDLCHSANRYPDVLPSKDYAVKLMTGDYINASYIRLNKTYIATQAPLPSTMSAFWRMVADHRVSVIVCLTSFLSRKQGRWVVSAHKYWPEKIDEVIQFDSITVELGYVTSLATDCMIYGIKIVDTNTMMTKFVEIIHYTGWPDMGVPRDTSTLESMMDYIHKYHSYGCPVVHCSAGIGRTGVMIAALEGQEWDINIGETVRMMRRCRPHMVQTEEQYNLIYRLLQ